MNLGSAGKNLIKRYEGCRLTAYKCPAGIWTIGYGHTGNVKQGQTITQAQADTLFDKDVQRFVDGVKKYVKVDINQNQFDALVSFAYNCGVGALQKSDLLKYINQKEFVKAASEFDRWNKGGGKVLAGLVKRRASEKELFSTPVTTVSKAAASDDKLYRLATGNFGNEENLKMAKKKLQEKYSWILYEKTDSGYRLVTGTFRGKNIAEGFAAELKELFGWTIYIQEA